MITIIQLLALLWLLSLVLKNRWFLITSRFSMEFEMKSEFNDAQQKSLLSLKALHKSMVI